MISNLFAIIIAFQDDSLYLFGDVLPCVLAEKGSYGVGGAVDLSNEIQRLRIGASAKPLYALLLGHCRKVVCNAVNVSVDFITSVGCHRASRYLLCDFFCCWASLARYSLA